MPGLRLMEIVWIQASSCIFPSLYIGHDAQNIHFLRSIDEYQKKSYG